MTRHSRRTIILAAVAIGLTAIIALYALLAPANPYFPRCLIRQITGFDCPGCGTQRAIHAILHGRWAQAWHYNAALFFAIPLIALLLAADAMRNNHPRLHSLLTGRPATTLLILAIAAWWIGRNIF